ncbi:hypothetical protein D6L24_24760 [Salmonella enterica subsp. enterica serovar Litchfield]|nr:hypothetical protein [Salmonella enterica subsp. enterica serovar Litchfield]
MHSNGVLFFLVSRLLHWSRRGERCAAVTSVKTAADDHMIAAVGPCQGLALVGSLLEQHPKCLYLADIRRYVARFDPMIEAVSRIKFRY